MRLSRAAEGLHANVNVAMRFENVTGKVAITHFDANGQGKVVSACDDFAAEAMRT
jgi:hypothetical protein